MNKAGGSPKNFNLLYDIFFYVMNARSHELHEKYPQAIIEILLQSCSLKEVDNVYQADSSYHFKGYPAGNLIKQFCTVLEIWKDESCFPIKFTPLEGFKEETHQIIERMNKLTPDLEEIFVELADCDKSEFNFNESSQNLVKCAKDFLLSIEPRGLLTCLGLRKTTGSQDFAFPQKSTLLEAFNRYNTLLDEEELQRNKNIPKLTVGARALTKHAHRSSEGFWGKNAGSEAQKNERANQIVNKILDECVWINIHALPHNEVIMECRIEKGYGARWTLRGEFRGFLEPQMEEGHEKKWRH